MERGEEFIYGLHLPPGFRFHPSDEELIVHYLLNKVKLRTIPSKVIGEIELYNFNPWELPKKALFGKDEWFFFSPRDRKYPNGSRPKRSAGSGFWKATGKDKPIFASSGLRKIGVKKALAFFTGHPTNSVKTNWTMSEYRLPESSSRASNIKGSMRLDDWVLCRVRQKGNMSKNKSKIQENPKNKPTSGNLPTTQELPSSYMITKANTGIISDHMFKDFQLMASILAGRDLPPLIETISTGLFQETKNDNTGTVYENGAFCEENVPFMFNEEIINNQDVFSGDMSTSDDSYDGFATDHLDVVMNIMEDGPFE